MTDITVTTYASIPAGTATVTVYEDTTGDGTPDNTATFTATDGTTSATLSGFDAIPTNQYRVAVTSTTGGPANEVHFNNITVAVPTVPSAPTGLSATVTADDIALSWTDTDTRGDGFYVYRATTSGTTTADYTRVATVDAATTTHTDSGLLDGEKYYYRVVAYNESGESNPSNEASAITALPAPTGLTADTVGVDQVDISWTPTHDNGNQRIEVKPASDSTWTNHSGAKSNTLASYLITGLRNGEQYDVRVVAYTDHVESIDQ